MEEGLDCFTENRLNLALLVFGESVGFECSPGFVEYVEKGPLPFMKSVNDMWT